MYFFNIEILNNSRIKEIMITEQQKQGVVEIIAHFYNTRFIQKLTDLKHKELLEQLETMFYTA
jgi:hypothetical protein